MDVNDISLDEMDKVTGGTSSTQLDANRKEFEEAWDALGMTRKGYSGMRKSELFDEWEMAGYRPDAKVFLSSY